MAGKTEERTLPVASGRRDPFETALERPVISGFHYFVRRLLWEERDVNEFIAAIEAKNPEVVITADEMGCGIVPVDPGMAGGSREGGRKAGGRFRSSVPHGLRHRHQAEMRENR